MRSIQWRELRMWLLLLWVATLGGWPATPITAVTAAAQTAQAEKPPITAASASQDELPVRVPAQFMSFRGADWLERHDREDQERPTEVVKVMNLKAGQVVADIGCGSGYFARRIAKVVGPTGKVFCEDIQPEMLEIMKQRAAEEGVTGVIPVLGTFEDPKLAKGTIDWMLLVDVYHEFESWQAMLGKMREALAPGGKVALIEYRAEDGTGDHISPAHRMSVRQVLGEWQSAGFRLLDIQEFLPAQHLFILESTDSKSAGPGVADLSLREAIRLGKVEAQALGAGDGALTLKVRRKTNEPLVVTTAAGTSFKAAKGEARDMVASRDGAVPLLDDNWHETKLMAAGSPRTRRAAGPSDVFDVELVPARPELAKLMGFMQSGGLPSGIVQASLLIALDDATYEEIEPFVRDVPAPAPHAIALAAFYASRAGWDVTSKKIWSASDRLIAGVPDPNLRNWLISQKKN